MAIFRRKKDILEGVSRVTIDKIVEKKHENGKIYFIITVSRKSDKATSQFWIVEDSYLIGKIIDAIFGEDEREEFDTNDFIGKEIIIDVKKGYGDYFNITNIKSVDEFECDEDEYEEENNLGFNDFDFDEDFLSTDEDFLSTNGANRRFR